MSKQTNKPYKQILRYIILDTNIFQHLGNESLGKEILKVLEDAKDKDYGLAFSQYSILELVDTSSLDIEKKRLKTIQGFKQFKVDQGILYVAGRLGCLYKDDGLTEKQQPEKGDKIIGATAVVKNCLIYTTNGKDFPPPYFKEVGRHWLTYKKNNEDVALVGYFFEPDTVAIIHRYAARTNNTSVLKLLSASENTEAIDLNQQGKDY